MAEQMIDIHDRVDSGADLPRQGFAPSGGETELDLIEMGHFLLRNKKKLGLWALIPAILTAIVVLIMRPVYTGESSFLPPNSMASSASSLLSSQLGALSGAGSVLGGFKDPAMVYVGILGSRAVADDLIRQFHLDQVYKTKKLSETERALKVNSKFLPGKDSIVTITVQDHDPKRAADLANAYLAALRKQNDRIALTEAGQKRLFFEQQLVKEKDALADAEVELARVQKQTGLIQPGTQAQLQMETMTQTQAQIASREVELAALNEAATEQNPNVIRLRSEIAGLKAQLSRLENSGNQGREGNIQVPTAKVPELTLVYVRKVRDEKFHEALYELLLRQYESAKLDESRSAPLVQVVDYASVPDTKSGPPRTLLVLLAALLGGFFGAVWLFCKYTLSLRSSRPLQRAKPRAPTAPLTE